VVCAELTPLFFEMDGRHARPYVTAGSNSAFTAGISPTRKGWFKMRRDRRCRSAVLRGPDLGQAGPALMGTSADRIRAGDLHVRRLYSSKNAGGFRNF